MKSSHPHSDSDKVKTFWTLRLSLILLMIVITSVVSVVTWEAIVVRRQTSKTPPAQARPPQSTVTTAPPSVAQSLPDNDDIPAELSDLIHRTKQIDKLLKQVAQQRSNPTSSLLLIEQLLAIDPTNEDGLRLRREIEDEQLVKALLDQARQYDTDLPAASAALDTLLAMVPNHIEAQQLKDKVQKKRQIDTLMSQAVAEGQRHNWSDAIAILDELMTLDATHNDAVRLMTVFQEERRITELLYDARQQMIAKQWTNAKNVLSEVLKLKKDHLIAKQLLVEVAAYQTEDTRTAKIAAEQAEQMRLQEVEKERAIAAMRQLEANRKELGGWIVLVDEFESPREGASAAREMRELLERHLRDKIKHGVVNPQQIQKAQLTPDLTINGRVGEIRVKRTQLQKESLVLVECKVMLARRNGSTREIISTKDVDVRKTYFSEHFDQMKTGDIYSAMIVEAMKTISADTELPRSLQQQ